MENQTKKPEKKSHPSVCPKCKYNWPIFLSYCPHCKELERDKKDPSGAILSKTFEKMGVKVVTESDLKPNPRENAANKKASIKGQNTQQKKQQNMDVKNASIKQGLPKSRKRATTKPRKSK